MNMIDVKDRVTQYTDLYKLVPVDTENNLYQLIQVPGTVTEEGTPINRALFESIRSDLVLPVTVHSKSIVVEFQGNSFTSSSSVSSVTKTLEIKQLSTNISEYDTSKISGIPNCRHAKCTLSVEIVASTFPRCTYSVLIDGVPAFSVNASGNSSQSKSSVFGAGITNITPSSVVTVQAAYTHLSDETYSENSIVFTLDFID